MSSETASSAVSNAEKQQAFGVRLAQNDSDKGRPVTFQEVSAASFRIKGSVLRSPCTLSHISETLGIEVYFKKEFLQYTGSFKERGARCALVNLSDDHKMRGVITASTGNFAMALSYHGKLLAIQITLVVPYSTPMVKIHKCRTYGATVVVFGNNVVESKEQALKMANEKNLTYIDGFDHPHVIAGHGTIGLELVEQMEGMDALLLPAGGGGTLAGVAVAVKTLKPTVTIVLIEPERVPCFTAAMKAGRPVYVPCNPTIADGLLVPIVGQNAFATALPIVDKVVGVSEEYISIAILKLMQLEKAIIEGSAAVTLGALMSGQLTELKGKRIVALLGGGNIDTTLLIRCLERGLTIDGRLVKFTVTIPDRPTGLSELTKTISDAGVTIKDIIHERAWLRTDVFSVRIKVVAETRDRDHARELELSLKQKYQEVYFNSGGSDRLSKSRSRSKASSAKINPPILNQEAEK